MTYEKVVVCSPWELLALERLPPAYKLLLSVGRIYLFVGLVSLLVARYVPTAFALDRTITSIPHMQSTVALQDRTPC